MGTKRLDKKLSQTKYWADMTILESIRTGFVILWLIVRAPSLVYQCYQRGLTRVPSQHQYWRALKCKTTSQVYKIKNIVLAFSISEIDGEYLDTDLPPIPF